jgi:hypothetical protein
MDLTASLRAAYQDQERKADPAFPEGPFRNFLRVDGELQAVYQPALNYDLIVGIQGSRRAIHDEVYLGPDQIERQQTVGSVYCENQLALLDKTVYLTGGGPT